MTKIVVTQFIAGEYHLTETAINDIMGAHAIERSKTSATIPVEGTRQVLIEGSKLKFATNGDLIKGKITKITYLESGAVALVATGLSLDAAKARTAYNHHSDYPIASSLVFKFTAPVSLPGVDNSGVDFIGSHGKDKLSGSAFNDYLASVDGADTLKGLGGDDRLEGGSKNDKIYGGAGNDSMFGSLGNDTIDGGDGRDWYFGPHSSSMSTTTALRLDLKKGVAKGFGTDKVLNVENAQGANGNDKLIGDKGDNVFFGNGGNDSLDGSGGSDKLFGGQGVDTLKGGKGSDYFVFGEPDGDHVKDFKPGEDKIMQLLPQDSSLPDGPISAANFMLGKSAADADDYFIYDRSTGKLYFDSDGNGGAGQRLVAVLDNKADLQASDIMFFSALNHPDFFA